MKKFFLYFLVFLFIAGLATLAYGFWNAKNIRQWATAAGDIKARHDISAKQKKIASQFESGGGKKMEDLKEELAVFSTNLDELQKQIESAKKETESLRPPRSARSVQKELVDFYDASGQKNQNLLEISHFINQLFEVALIFDSIKQDTKLQEIQAIIAEAKNRSAAVNVEILPEEMRGSSQQLKDATENFLDAIDRMAAGEANGKERLNEAYADFSQKEDDFFANAKKYVKSLQGANFAEGKIDSSLLILRRVKFSIK